MAATDFLLDLEAQLTGGSETISELQKLEDALTSGKQKYAELEKSSASTSKQLEKLGGSISKVSDELRQADESGDMKGAARATKVIQKLVAKEDELKAHAAATTAALDKEGKELTQLASAFREAAKAEESLGKKDPPDFGRYLDGIKKLGVFAGFADQAGDAFEGVEKLGGGIGKLGGVAALGGLAIIALGAAFAKAAIDVAVFTLKLGLAERDLKLTLTAMEAATGVAGGEMRDAFTETTTATGIASDRLLDVTRSLKEAGVAGADLPIALKAIAMQESALADTGGTQALIDSLKEGKTTARQLGAEMESQFGDVVSQRVQGLDQQWTIFTDKLGQFASKLPLDAILGMIQKVADLFDDTTSAGSSMKAIFDAFVPSVGDGSDAVTVLEGIILDVVYAGLRLAIAIKKVEKATSFAPGTGLEGISVLSMGATIALGQVELALNGVAGMADQASLGADAFNAAWAAAAGGAEDMWTDVKAEFEAAQKWIAAQAAKFKALGALLMDSLSMGISGATETLKEKTERAVDAGIIAPVQTKTKTHSPSVWAIEVGEDIMAGFPIGFDHGAPAMNDAMIDALTPVQRTVASMVDEMRAAEGSSTSGPVRVRGERPKVNITLQISVDGRNKDNDELAQKIREEVVEAMRQVAEQLGDAA